MNQKLINQSNHRLRCHDSEILVQVVFSVLPHTDHDDGVFNGVWCLCIHPYAGVLRSPIPYHMGLPG